MPRPFLEGWPRLFRWKLSRSEYQIRNAKQIHEMSGARRSQGLLAIVLRIVPYPASPSFVRTPHETLHRSYTIAIPKRAATSFSVSFAPEPNEHETEVFKGSKAPDRKAESKKSPPTKARLARKLKSLKAEEHRSDHGSKARPDNTQAVGALESSPISPQIQETPAHAEQVREAATTDPSGADSTRRTVEVSGEDDLLEPEGHITEEVLRATLRAARKKEEWKVENERRTTLREAKRKEGWKAEKEPRADILIGSGFAIDEIPVIRQRLSSEIAKTEADPTSKRVTNGREPHIGSKDIEKKKTKLPGSPHSPSSPREEGRPLPERTLASKSSEALPKSKKDIQAKPHTSPPAKKEPWQVQKQALENKFGSEGWNPRKKLSPDAIDGIRALHAQYPDEYPTPVLAQKFKISPEAIRRILKSKWRPDANQQIERKERWAKRHDRIWDQQAAIGLRPARTKARKPKEPGDLDDERSEIEEFQIARTQKQARDMHLTGED